MGPETAFANSYKSRRSRVWPDVGQGAGTCCIRAVLARRRQRRFDPLASRPDSALGRAGAREDYRLGERGRRAGLTSPAPQIVIKHRATDEQVQWVKDLLSPLNSRYVDLSYDEHDEVTANTQAVTHAAFLS